MIWQILAEHKTAYLLHTHMVHASALMHCIHFLKAASAMLFTDYDISNSMQCR